MNIKNNADTIDLAELLASPQDMSPVTYQYYKNLAKRTIIFNDQVSADVVESVIVPLLEWDNDGTGKEINILISSVGGSVFDGLVLCDVIDRLKTKTKITVLGYTYSMAGLILMAGFNNPNVTKVCYPFSSALIHSGSSYIEGATNIVKDTFRFQEKFDEKIKEYIISHSKISKEEYEKNERYEWYMTSSEMLSFGLVDKVL